MSDLEARIAEVIAAHGRDGRKTWGSFVVCTCEPAWTGHSLEHPAHVAALLAPVIADAKAEALREAVSDFQHSVGVGEFDEQTRRDGNRHAHIDEAWEYQSPYMDWLLNRADNLATS